VEALGLLVVTVFLIVELVVSTPSNALGAVVIAALALVAALGLALVARGLLGAARWSRAPALVTNLILLPVGYGLVQGHVWYAGIPLLLLALAVLALLFAPSTAAALDDD
jgi:hypothetical protein